MSFLRLSRRSVVVFLALSLLGGACRGAGEGAATPSPSPSATPPGPPQLEVLARVPVGAEPIGIVEGFGSIWVVNSEFDSGGTSSVSRIEPASASVEGNHPGRRRASRGRGRLRRCLGLQLRRRHRLADRPGDERGDRDDRGLRRPEGMAPDDEGLWVVCERAEKSSASIRPPTERDDPSRWVWSPGS